MIPVLLILIPLVTGLISFFLSGPGTAKNWSLLASVATLIVALAGVYMVAPGQLSIDTPWLPVLGARSLWVWMVWVKC
jgi:NADH-quinone oxidoreductase subunit M